MPIEMRYGGENIGALAALAMLAGAGQREVPEIPRFAAGGRGGGGGGGGGRAPRRRTTRYRPPERPEMSLEEELRTRAEYKIKEEYWGQELEKEKKQLENEMTAEGWELKYDAASRKIWQKGNETLRRIDEGEREGTIAPNEATAMRTQTWRNMMGVGKSLTPPDPNKLKFEEGKEPGKLWPGEGGSIMTTDPETGIPKLIQRWDQGPEAAQLKYEAEEKKATIDLQSKQDEKEEISREKYSIARNAFKAKMFEKYSEAEEDPNVALQNAEVAAQRLYPSLGLSRGAKRQRGEFDEALEDRLKRNAQIRAAGKYGVKFTEEESNAPAEIREAILFTRAAVKQYGNRPPPPEVQAELTKAANIMREFDAAQEEEARMMQEALQEAGPNPGLRGFGVEADLRYLED